MTPRAPKFGLQFKLWLGMGAVLLGGFGTIQFAHYRSIQENLLDQALTESRALRGVLMATRRVYHHQFIDSGLPLNEDTVGFLPAHALSRISTDFNHWDESGRSFNNVSERARNPRNRADRVELEAIRHFENNPGESELLRVVAADDGRSYYHYAQPIRVEEYCLQCHGDRESAPETVRLNYAQAYGYVPGELRGIMSIKLPEAELRDQAWSHLLASLRNQLLVFAVLFAVGGVMLQRFVIGKLSVLKRGALALAEGDYDMRVDLGGRDELEELGRAFNHMAGLIAARDKRLREVQAFAGLGYWTLDAETGSAHWSAEIGTILQAPAGVEPGLETLASIVHPDDHAAVVESLQRSLRHGEPHNVDYRLRAAAGGERWVNCQAHAVRGPDGRVIRLDGFLQDISGRKRAEQQTAEARRLAEQYLNVAGVIMLALDRDGRVTLINPKGCEVLGRTREQILGQPWFRHFLPPRERERALALFAQAIAGEEDAIRFVDDRVITATGDERIIAWHNSLIRDHAGRVIGTLSSGEDVTERREAERALAEERSFLQNVIDGIDDPILVVGRDYEVLRMNRVARAAVTRDADVKPLARCHQLLCRSDRPCGGDEDPCPMQQVLDCGQPTKVVQQRKGPDGMPRTYEIAASPLRDDQGEVIGIIEASRDITEHLALLGELREQRLSYAHLAQHDPLTSLPNRVLFADRLSQALHDAHRNQRQVAVLFIDLDRFKQVNDSFDHSTGDEVLQTVARRLATIFREDDTVARMGGDEFTVILRRLRSENDAARVARKILALFQQPFEVRGHAVFLGASIGISLYPQHGETVDDLVRNADTAMYRAKEDGRNTFQYYTEDLTANAFERVLLEASLHQAMERRELVLHYQPQLRLDTGALCGLEALVRWQHPEMGLVPPARFVPLAEESGMIVPIGEWVLGVACAQMKAWLDDGLVDADATISVNLSAKQFDQGNLIAVVEKALADSGLAAESLELEITESTMMRSPERSASRLNRLREMGVKVAIDDFGTGYSSLNYLKRLPLTKLKIDRSFVADLATDVNDLAIARAIIALARSLSLEVLAEGIETEEQRRFLVAEGCEAGQGYLFARPMDPDSFAGFARRE
jgi:diguanylate cyclase (GGDEF)-like protein/PAS domain S-box-containing protein